MAKVWQEPVFDRTQEDVDFAITKIAEWIASGTFSEVYDLKGCLNVSDINRIEGNIAYLSERLTGLAYPISVSTKQWDKNDLPNEDDIGRIINNVRACVQAYYQPDNAPSIPQSMASYSDINAIEKNIDLIKYLIDLMVSSFHKSGTFQSGSTTFLPMRR